MTPRAPEVVALSPEGLTACGRPLPPAPAMPYLAEDFSLLVRRPKRLRMARGRRQVLS